MLEYDQMFPALDMCHTHISQTCRWSEMSVL